MADESTAHAPSQPAPTGPPVPEIGNSVSQDVPPASYGQPDATSEVKDPEADHRRGMDKTKLWFAIAFTSVTAFAALCLGMTEYFTPDLAARSAGVLSSTGDVLKLLATTSLGFVFGRTLGNGEG